MDGDFSLSDALLADLTDPQREAVTHVQGPMLVLAGAGSGKTRVITRRIAYLVLRVGIAPWNVLAITFTNKAAGEMKQRVEGLLSPAQARSVTVCTFHSLCARILRKYADRLGLPPGFSIYDSADQERAVKTALEAAQISSSNFPPSKILSAIGSAKNDLIDPEAYARDAQDFSSRNIAKVYRQYQEVLRKNQALDFDDLLMATIRLMREHPAVLAELRHRYQYLLIDEYQDTNHAQFLIAYAIAGGEPNAQRVTGGSTPGSGLGPVGGNICATGDPDQSIYGWRGANIHNILEFESHYPQAKVVRLEQNYRSTKNILAVADGLIQHNQQRKHKSLWTENEEGEPVRAMVCRDERAEAAQVLEQFQVWQKQYQLSWGDMAVFYRMNSLSRVMEETLRKAGVPYQIARGTAFYDRKEIKDSLAYLRTIANPADEVNLLRIINTPARGISDTTVKTMQARALAMGQSLIEMVHSPQYLAGLNNRALASVQKFARLFEGWRKTAGLEQAVTLATEPQHELSLRDWVDQVLRESGLHQFYASDKSDPDQERLANLGELVSSAQQFETDYERLMAQDPSALTLARKLQAYLEQVSLVSDVDSIKSAQGAVTLMTLHAAKGLEFSAVAILGMEDGLLPHDRANSSPSQLEEERRLCFVGITRAMRLLVLMQARYRTVFGQTMPTIPSRFLREIPAAKLVCEDVTLRADDLPGHDSSGEGSVSGKEGGSVGFGPGSRVRHPHFGLGRVLRVMPMGSTTRAQVQFNTAGLKTLVLEYANLEQA